MSFFQVNFLSLDLDTIVKYLNLIGSIEGMNSALGIPAFGFNSNICPPFPFDQSMDFLTSSIQLRVKTASVGAPPNEAVKAHLKVIAINNADWLFAIVHVPGPPDDDTMHCRMTEVQPQDTVIALCTAVDII